MEVDYFMAHARSDVATWILTHGYSQQPKIMNKGDIYFLLRQRFDELKTLRSTLFRRNPVQAIKSFQKVFEAFNDINYRGPFTFETTRGSDPVNTAKYNINFAKFFIKNAELSV